jgi:hypothetical protein
MHASYPDIPLGANIIGWQMTVDGPVPIPQPCSCGEPARYGRDERWYCSPCWQASQLWRTQCAVA